MSDTPRTDASCWRETGTKNGEVVQADFARQLEREIAAAWRQGMTDAAETVSSYHHACTTPQVRALFCKTILSARDNNLATKDRASKSIEQTMHDLLVAPYVVTTPKEESGQATPI